MKFEQILHDGDRVAPGDVAFYVSGRLRSLLQAERILLNIMQRMSGVATQTAVYVKRLEGLRTKVLDTRKTTPGMRVLDKMAVKIGGGENHRMGLFDMILLKDNHIDFAGGIRPAIDRRAPIPRGQGQDDPDRVRGPHRWKTSTRCFAAGGVDRIMFDNFTPAMTREAVEEGRRTLRDRIERRHHARHDARLRRVRRRLHLGGRADAPDQVARHVAEGLRIARARTAHENTPEHETPAAHAARRCCVRRIALLYAALMLCRAAFWVYNAALLGPPELERTGAAAWPGSLKFDTASVVYADGVFVTAVAAAPARCANGKLVPPWHAVLVLRRSSTPCWSQRSNLADTRLFPLHAEAVLTADEIFFADNGNSLQLAGKVHGRKLVSGALLCGGTRGRPAGVGLRPPDARGERS